LTRDENAAWQVVEPDSGTAEANIIQIAASSLAKLRAVGFADTVDATTAGFDPDTTWIRGTLADGSSHELQVGLPSTENRVFVRKKGGEQIFILPIGAIRTMMPPAEAILKTQGETPGFKLEN
jgi:hypothetical protein